MATYTDMVRGVRLPLMIKARQSFERPRIADVQKAAREATAPFSARIQPGMRVAITCGSRGVSHMPDILRELVRLCEARGAKPFIFPAMGSHGGGTAAGQRALIEGYGVTEAYCGCPILSSMEVVQIGETAQGHPVLADQHAASADAIIPVNRIKAHTAYRGDYESGLMKMLAIGMGKHAGAQAAHQAGFGQMHSMVPAVARVMLQKLPVVFGVAIIENAYDETAGLYAIPAEGIEEEEPRLLREAKRLMGSLLFEKADVLIVDRLGKDISGEGADPNVTGRFPTPYASGGLRAERRVCLGITDASHGNAYGLGLFDSMPRHMYDAVDWDSTYTNAITNTVLAAVYTPMVMPSDREAIAVALRSCNEADFAAPRMIRIKDTLHLEEIYISEALRGEAERHPGVTLLGPPEEFAFDEAGNLRLL